jgi:hypothetical protein
MQRAFLLILVVLGTPAATVGQTAPSESQTLQALLTEVRGLRHDLQVSLTRVESAQILLFRLQIQQVAVTRASQHVDETRSKLAEVQLVQKTEAAKVASLTSFKDAVSADPKPDPKQQGDFKRGSSARNRTSPRPQSGRTNVRRRKRRPSSNCKPNRINSRSSKPNWTSWSKT